jgi:hypothetical protein
MAVGDVIHVYVCCYYLGEKVMDVGSWNDTTWGNIGIATTLFLCRLVWFLTVGLKGSSENKKKE